MIAAREDLEVLVLVVSPTGFDSSQVRYIYSLHIGTRTIIFLATNAPFLRSYSILLRLYHLVSLLLSRLRPDPAPLTEVAHLVEYEPPVSVPFL